MRAYGQYCPIARGAEIFAERWTPIIVRNLHLGYDTFGEILRGAPGIPKSLLSQRLRDLERTGLVERVPNGGRGSRYQLTPAGSGLWDVCMALGTWGARWLEVGPEHLDPYVVLWAMRDTINRDRVPARRVVVRFEFRDQPKATRNFWLLIEPAGVEVCVSPPGDDEDLVVTALSEPFVMWHMGRMSWRDAVRSGGIAVDGAAGLARSFPTWNELSHFAHIKPEKDLARSAV